MAAAQALNKGFAYRFAFPIDDPKWWLSMDVALVRGRLECVRLMVEPYDAKAPEAITTTVLRSLAMPELVEQFTSRVRDMIEASGSMSDSLPAERSRRGRPPERDPSEVARVYTNALAKRRPPTAAVAEHFDISHSAAAKAVYTARRHGHLPPTGRGVPAAASF